MRSIEIHGVTIEVDAERTAELYKYPGLLDWCQCDLCTNARMTHLHSTPPEQKHVLNGLGLSLRLPCHSTPQFCFWRKSKHHRRHLSCWLAYGRIVDAEATSVLRLDRDNWMWADTRRENIDSLDTYLEQVECNEPDLIYLVASNKLPWLFGEVCGFRDDYVAQRCPECASQWRQTGYLRRGSRIPEWRNQPELTRILRKREHRVYVEFRALCGRMEHRVVENKPPFRTKNTLYDDEMKARGWNRFRAMFL